MRNRAIWIFMIALVLLAAPSCSPKVPSQEILTYDQVPELEGRWAGELTVLETTYDIVVNFEVVNNMLQGRIDIPKQGVTGLELSAIRFEAGKVHFEMKSNLPVAVFDAGLHADGHMSGEYRQMGFKGKFTLARAEAPVETPAAQEPLPYLEEEVVITNGSIRLAGTLSLPKTGGPHPAIILVSGSGLQDRNSAHPAFPGYEPFKWLADHLTRNGIAVLRYDDRGTGESVGGEYGVDTTLDYAGDAEAVLDYLLARPEIDPGQIGVLGHSEGAHIAAILAARRAETAFVISMAGMAVDGEALLMRQTEEGARADGLDEEEIARQVESNREEIDLILSEDWDALREMLTGKTTEYYQKLPPDQRVADSELEAAVRETVDQNMKSMQGWFHYFLSHDPARDWEQVKVPVLALFGEKDTQVSPAQNRAPLEAALARAGNQDVTVVVFAETNHLFQVAQTGGSAEYTSLPMEFTTGLLDTVRDWILQRLGSR